MGYEIRIVERDCTLVRTLVAANAKTASWEVNGPGEITFGFPKHDPTGATGQGADVDLGNREVQLWRDGVCLKQAVLVHAHASSKSGEVDVTAPGLGWYLTRRNIDAERHNYLTNPGFETGTFTGWDAAVNCTRTIVTSPRVLGAYAAKLVGGTTGADQFLPHAVFTVSGGDIGLFLDVAAWFHITSWTGPAFESRGLYVDGIQAGVRRTGAFSTIDDATPQGVDQRAETGIWVPPGETWDIYVRAYCPNGEIEWDAFEVVAMESLSVAVGGTDLADLAGAVVSFIQDPAHGKDDLSIVTSTPTSGVIVPFPWAKQYADHSRASSVINDELVPLGLDWSLEANAAGTTKTFATHHPRMGTDRTGTLTIALGGAMAEYDYDEDIAGAETDVTMLGDGDGPDREEGHAVDTSTLNLVLQGVYNAPAGTPIASLGPMAQDRVARTARKVKLPQVVTVEKGGALIGVLGPGDVANFLIDDGWVQVLTDPYRVVKLYLDCRRNTLALTLNEE